jgi:hypothetical protein
MRIPVARCILFLTPYLVAVLRNIPMSELSISVLSVDSLGERFVLFLQETSDCGVVGCLIFVRTSDFITKNG